MRERSTDTDEYALCDTMRMATCSNDAHLLELDRGVLDERAEFDGVKRPGVVDVVGGPGRQEKLVKGHRDIGSLLSAR